ncbi:MAG: RNA polymerase sigma-70 factor [Prevotella sp.]
MGEHTDQHRFSQLYTMYNRRFIHFAKTYVDDEMMAEDIVADSMMYFWENRHKVDAQSNVPAYVLTVIKHKCLDHLRQMRVREDYESYVKTEEFYKQNVRITTLEACNPERIFSRELQELVNKTLMTLPPQTREIFIRSRYRDQSHKEIAEALGLSTKSVEFHITKALKVMRVTLKDYLPLFLFGF